jgi:hypothetical protein
MMAEIVRTCWALLGDHVEQVPAQAGAKTARDALKAQMTAFVQYAMERPSRNQLLFAGSFDLEHDIDGPLRPTFRPVRESIEAIAAGGGKVPVEDPFIAALLVVSLAHGASRLPILRRDGPETSRPMSRPSYLKRST